MPISDPNIWHRVGEYIPFIGMMVGGPKPSPVIVRLIESAIIGAVLLYGTVQVLGTDMKWLKEGLQDMKDEITILQEDVKNLAKEVYEKN